MLGRLALTLVCMLVPFAAQAVEIVSKKELSAAPAAVWATVGDFCGVAKWHPMIAKCELSNKGGETFRTLTLKGGGAAVEKQTTFDAPSMSYSYTIQDSPLPVKNCKVTLKVEPKDKGSLLTWTANFDAAGAPEAEAVKVMTGIFEAGSEGINTAK